MRTAEAAGETHVFLIPEKGSRSHEEGVETQKKVAPWKRRDRNKIISASPNVMKGHMLTFSEG